MRALAAAVLATVLARSARAEDAPARAVEDAPWFVGAFVGYGKLTPEHDAAADGTTFLGEGGRFLFPWLAVSLSVGLGRRHGKSTVFGPVTALELQDLTAGPRLSLTPLRGRIRIGLGLGVLRQRSARLRIENHSTTVERELATYTELHAGAVPLRRDAFEVEVGASRGTAGAEDDFGGKSWYAVGVGLRWYGRGASSPEPAGATPPRPSRWALAPSLGMLAMQDPGGPTVRIPFVELALRHRPRHDLELELAIRHGRPRLRGQFSEDDTDIAITAEHATLALRRRIWMDGPASAWAGGGLGLAMAAHVVSEDFESPDEELRPLVMAGVGAERRYHALSLRAELGLSLLFPSSYSGGAPFISDELTVERFRQASLLLLGGVTAGAAYHF